MRKGHGSALLVFTVLIALGLLFAAKPAYAASLTVSPSAAPNPIVVGQSTTISTPPATGGTTPYTYAWSGLPAGCSSSNSVSITCVPSGVGSGSFSVTVTVTDSATPTNSGMATFTLTVNQATSTTAVSCAPSTVIVGSPSPTTCTAAVSGYPPNGATGTVTFTQFSGTATTSLASSPTFCTLASGTCFVSVSTTGAGGATILATYSGDSNNIGSSGSTTLTVSPATSTTSVICSPATLLVGKPSTCSATVVGYSPTGIITWQSTDKGGIFSANPCTLSSASCGITYTPTQSATITAVYSGDTNNVASSGTFSITANVNETIQITVANSGPPTTVSLSGCSVSPTSIPANGTPYNFQASSGCSPITITLPPAGTNSRYLSSAGLNSLTVGSCSSSSCQTFSATIYYQVENTYQASPKSPASWTTPGSIVVNGTTLDSAGQTICTISVTTGSGTFSCQGWTDYNTQAGLGLLQVSPTQRWATSQNAFTDVAGGNQHTSSYYSQVLEGFEYSLIGSTTSPSTPRLNFTAFGAPDNLPLIGSASSVWLDSGSSWTVPSALAGSTSSERWDSSVNNGAATAGQTVSLQYYNQFFITFGYSVIGGGTAYQPPSVLFTSFGASARGSQSWVDAGSSFNYTNPLVGSSAVERWFAGSPLGVINQAGSLTELYYHQYAFVLNFGVLDGGAYSNPRLNYTSLGVQGLAQLNATQTTFWLDSGTSWAASALLPSSSPSEQWITKTNPSGIASAPLSGDLMYYHQYLDTLHYTVQGSGGSPPVPSLNYTSEGATLLSPLGPSATGFWMDSGSTWEVPLLLPGTHGERWMSNQTTAAIIAQPTKLDVQYAHQFYVEVGVSTPAGGAEGTQNEWHDQGSTVVLNETTARQWAFAYWQGATAFSYNGTTISPTLLVTGAANETAIFFPGLNISTDGQGSVAYSYGSISGTVQAGANATIYPPPGRNVTLTAIPGTVEIMFQGWTLGVSGTQIESASALKLQTAVSIFSPGTVHASFATDYTDIRTFAVATLVVFIGAAYVFVVRRGFTPKLSRVPKS